MKRPQEVAILLTTLMVLCGSPHAQTAYRCGNAYSASPCEGAKPVDVSDPRTPEQRAQTAQAAQRDAREATELERRRLREEKGLPPDEESSVDRTHTAKGKAKEKKTATPKDKKSEGEQSASAKPKKKGAKSKEPEYFTVRSPTEPDKKKKSAAP